MFANRSPLVQITLRETLLVLIAAFGAFLFFHHNFLDLQRPFAPVAVRPEAYVVTTFLLYVFIRMIAIVVSVRVPRVVGDLELCPECGQAYDDGTPKGLEHHRVALTPTPTEQDILAAVGLRKAIDDARRVAQRRAEAVEPSPVVALRGDVANPPIDLEAQLGAEWRRSGSPMPEPVPKGRPSRAQADEHEELLEEAVREAPDDPSLVEERRDG